MMKLKIMSWNIEDIFLNWYMFVLLLDRFKPSLVFLQETRLYTHQINELSERLPGYTIFTLLPQDLLETMEKRIKFSKKRAVYGLVVAVRDDDPTHIKVLKKDSNSYLAFIRDGIMMASIYMPQQGRGVKAFSMEMNKLASCIEKNCGNNQLFLMGDWNLSKKHKRQRHEVFDSVTEPWDIVTTKPDTHTNVNFCGSKSCLDWVSHSQDIEVTLEVLSHEKYPMNQSSHAPIIADIEYLRDIDDDGCGSSNGPAVDNSKFFFKHEKLDPNCFDFELYKRRSRIYALTALKTMKGANVCELMSLLAHMLCFAADACVKSTHSVAADKNPEDLFSLDLDDAKRMETDFKNFERYIYKKRYRLVNDFLLLSSNDLEEIGVKPGIIAKLRKYEAMRRRRKRTIKEIRAKYKRQEQERLMAKLESLRKIHDSKSLHKLTKEEEVVRKGLPIKLKVKGKTYKHGDVLAGFSAVAKEEANDPMTDVGAKIPREFISMKDINAMALAEAEMDDTVFLPLDRDSFKELLKEIPTGRAADVSGLMIEHIIWADDTVIDLIMDCLNCLLEDIDWSTHPLLSLSMSSYLYKGRGKPMEDPSAFRRLQISSLYCKILQRLSSAHLGLLTSKHVHEFQFGFRAGVSFLLCSILRETLSRHAYYSNDWLAQVSTDVKNAFCTTLRPNQMAQLISRGEKGKLLKFSNCYYKNTNFIIKDGESFSEIISENKGGPQGGLLTTVQFPLYTLPLQEMIDKCGIEVKRLGINCKNETVADDQVNKVTSLTDFMVLSDLFQYYQEIYQLQFGWAKTQVNVFASEDPDEDLKTVSFGGVSVENSRSFTHLCLEVTSSLFDTDSTNVTKRLERAEKCLWENLGDALRDNQQLPFTIIKKIVSTTIIPCLVSGLQALVISQKQLDRLDQFLKTLWRRIFGLPENSSIVVLI